MKTKLILPVSMLISAMALIISGLFIMINPLLVEGFIVQVIQIIITVIGLLLIISVVFNRKTKNKVDILRGILYIGLGVFIEYKIKFISVSLVVIIGVYAFINFIVQLISTIILYNNKTKIWIVSSIHTFISLVSSMILIFHPIKSKELLGIVSGIYLILYGMSKFFEFIREILNKNIKDNLKSKIRIRLPVIYTAIIPQRILEKINNALKVDSHSVFVDSKSDEKGELEIFIHLSKEMANGFGHVDICFNNRIYSYGTYDSSSNRLLGFVSDGVLIEGDRDKYIKFATKTSHVVSFVLSLNTRQYKAIENKIKLIKSKCKRWYCEAELDDSKEYDDFTNSMYIDTNCEFYKFKSGYFKTYFVFTTNCVKLADSIICTAGIGGININGIITPGVYFKMFDNLFKMDNSIVVRRNIYRKISKDIDA